MTHEHTGPAGDERPETAEDEEPEVIAHCDDSEELPWCVGFSV